MSVPFFQLFTVTLNPTFDTTCLLDGLEPGRINRVQASRTDPGGKGINLSRVFARFQQKSLALGIAGKETAPLLQKRLEEEGVASAFFTVPGAVRENMTYLLPDHREYKVNQPGPSLPSGTLKTFLPWMEQHISGINTVIAFAGSFPAGMSGDEFVDLASHFQTKSRVGIGYQRPFSFSAPSLPPMGDKAQFGRIGTISGTFPPFFRPATASRSGIDSRRCGTGIG